MVGRMSHVTWLEGTFVETIKGWQSGWFYITEPRDPEWAAPPRIQIWHPHTAHLLERERPGMG